MNDLSQALQQRIADALERQQALTIVGGNSKAFYGLPSEGERLDIARHQGIISYEPSELVVTARAGTPLQALQEQLRQQRQMLPFEPPHFGPDATIGGTIACNFSGPRRPYAGAARDYLLGCKIINGKAEVINFGGEVMKNVAGYDVSRLMAGAMGTLGVLLEVSLKVLPMPAEEITLVQALPLAEAIEKMNQWAARPLPLSASAYHDGQLYVRLSGAHAAVTAAQQQLGGEPLDDGDTFWQALREQQLDFFKADSHLWRLSLPPTSPPLDLDGATLLEWGGGLRWLQSELPAQQIFQAARQCGGHATLFRPAAAASDPPAFQQLDPHLLALHRRLKHAFDPASILNPGRLIQGV